MAKVFHFHANRQQRDAPIPARSAAPPKPGPSWRERRIAIYVAALALVLLIVLVELARAGGPQYVAGVSYFNAGLAGQPITWTGGAITYYTDQGDLSPLLHGPDADTFVAGAFSRWTQIPTAAISATRGGQLAEDVSGANVFLNDHSISVPVDIQPTATSKPIAVVYDADGAVTDALIGSGASDDCFTNAAFGGVDAFTVDGHFAHALVVIDGNCAQTSNSLPDLRYRLVRVLGRVLGLGWSQLNLNVITGTPQPSQDDLAGLPVMHEEDLSSCVPISVCYPNPDVPKMDDHAALSRLYPVTGANLSQFQGKQIFAANTGRIHGSVKFTDSSGNPAQPMQGVNVVARCLDCTPAGYAASSVSGFLFSGNAGNAITGYTDARGNDYRRFGSTDTTLEGFFDLGGLEVPNGDGTRYQLSVEALDGNLSQNVGPYAPWQVLPSGSMQPIVMAVTRGSDLQQDILMNGSAIDTPDPGAPDNFTAPRALPKTGDWAGTLGSYGDDEYFWLNGQTNRTLTVEVTALDDSGQPTVGKLQPVIGMWSLAAPPGTPPPAYTSSSLNTSSLGLTQLNARLLSTTQFRIGVADLRGDGRPDFRYRARVLYGDSVTPNRVSARGGMPILLTGYGFKTGMTMTVDTTASGSTSATLLSISAGELVATTPPMADSVQNISLTDPATGASSKLTGALTFGAGPNDTIRLVQGANSGTPVGAEAAYPVRVTVSSSDGLTAVNGATVQWSATNGAGLSACNGAATCYAFTDESGQLETRVSIGAVGTTTISAALAPASYTPPKTVQVSIGGTSSAKDLALFSPKVWVMQGATLDIPLTARLLSTGVPLSGQTLNWSIGIGSGSLNSANSTTDGAGYGRSTLHVSQLAGDVQGTVCVAPGNAPCQTFYVIQVLPSALKLQRVSGSYQTISVGQTFQPITVRATNSATPPNPVTGVPVSFQSMIFLPDADAPVETSGDDGSSQHAMKVLLDSSLVAFVTDSNGLASFPVSTGGFSRPLEVEITASAGTGTPLQFELPMLPAITPTPGGSTGRARRPAPVSVGRQRVETVPRTQSPRKVFEEVPVSRMPIPVMVDAILECRKVNSAALEEVAAPDAEKQVAQPVRHEDKCDTKHGSHAQESGSTD